MQVFDRAWRKLPFVHNPLNLTNEMNSTFSSIAMRLSLAFFLALGVFSSSYACDRTDIVLDSVVFDGVNYNIYITQNVGGGVTGSTRGAGNDTFTFAYAFYGAPTMSISFFTPALTGDSTGVTNPGINVGPAFGGVFTIGYVSTGSPYACISSTAFCGQAHTDTKQVLFTVSEVPDSIRLFGMEGTGNPLAGCYPDQDMLVDFTILPVVWNDLSGRAVEDGIEVNWSTSQEINTSHFEVFRSADGISFESMGTLDASGNSTIQNNYRFLDEVPLEGSNFYRITQYDVDGRRSNSGVVEVNYSLDPDLGWTAIAPNPVENTANVGFTVPEEGEMSLQVIDLKGALVLQQDLQVVRGTNVEPIDLSDAPAGMYIVRLIGPQGRLDRKIVKN